MAKVEPVNNIARVIWDERELRYELYILNKLKAYSTVEEEGQEETKENHEQGRKDLIKMAKDKGYTVIDTKPNKQTN